MKKYTLFSLALMAILTLQSCEMVEGIFKAGMWWAFILVFLVIGGILWLISKGKK